MDQTNPLAELTHKRRLSALGPGGLSRERANMEVRDVHYSHYGRMCPIETPEGPNIGLISYLATYARINEYGFIEAPYRAVDKETCKVTDEITYMTADEEDNYYRRPGRRARGRERLPDQRPYHLPAPGRDRGRGPGAGGLYRRLPRMMVSIATAMIPFLPNDDANRALMGANMQRQAVPLLAPRPHRGHRHGAQDLHRLRDRRPGRGRRRGDLHGRPPRSPSSYDSGEIKDYKLTKFLRSNHGTCINQRPIVSVRPAGGETARPTVLADGPATEQGEIALGQNILVGFMTWEGYNYEDAVLLNERLVREDAVHLHPHRGV